jgi:hypothetical protein
MTRAFAMWAVCVCWAGTGVCLADEPPGVLDRFLEKIKGELHGLPDYVCMQRIDRFSRGMSGGPWRQDDTLRFSVGLVGGKELYARPDSQGFDDSELADHARTGVVSTGQFGLLAHHVFTWKAARFGYVGESERAGRRAYEYEYDVPAAESTFRLRMGSESAVVAFQGSFHVDAGTMDLLELEVQAYDIPERVGLAMADTKVVYARTEIRGMEALIPANATLTVTTSDGVERMNRARFGECRRFETVSSLVVPQGAADEPAAGVPRTPGRLVPGTMLGVQLDADLLPAQVQPGDPIRARLTKSVEGDDGTLLPVGTVVHGFVVRLRREERPIPVYEIGLEFVGVECEDGTLPLTATMVDVEARGGVIRQARRLDPTFSKKQSARLDVLVREVQKGQGILLWDAKRTTVPKGLKMTWRVGDGTGR